ncbi:MAG: hypothetical protein AAB588_03675 [Patescibacteria group bacterium]
MLGDQKPKRELDETSASAADDRFEEILKKVKAAGAEITKDEESPLMVDMMNDFVEIGETRLVEFSLNKMEFQIIRNVKNMRFSGEGMHKKLENITRPIIELKLKSRPQFTDQWIGVDIEDVF